MTHNFYKVIAKYPDTSDCYGGPSNTVYYAQETLIINYIDKCDEAVLAVIKKPRVGVLKYILVKTPIGVETPVETMTYFETLDKLIDEIDPAKQPEILKKKIETLKKKIKILDDEMQSLVNA